MTAAPFVKRAREARNVVVLTGAGVSVASGLKPYRGPGGLWTTNPELASRLVAGVDAETLWTVTCDWRKELAKAEPNAAHRALAAFERNLIARGGAFTLITQNVDGLHTRAGSLNVIEFHGTLKRSRCAAACGAEPFIDERDEGPLPTCERCGAPVRPDIVLFNEMIGALEDWTAKRALRDADLFVAIGTSGTVSPASNFVRSAAYVGAHTVLMNLEAPDPVPFTEVIRGEAQTLVPELFS
jgi:NAD-dependent deacetylase